MSTPSAEERRFLDLVEANRRLLYKICYMYATDGDHFNDLYQEVLANIWQGLATFRGDSAVSTWIYRVAINTCVSNCRSSARHRVGKVSLDEAAGLAGDDPSDSRTARIRQMYELISGLSAMDKALILMWLDEKSYDEISELTGISRSNVAVRLHRAKQKLIERNNSLYES